MDINKIFERKIVNIFLPLSFNIFLGAQKNRLIETVLLSTHNICFGWEIRKLYCWHALLTKVLMDLFESTCMVGRGFKFDNQLKQSI